MTRTDSTDNTDSKGKKELPNVVKAALALLGDHPFAPFVRVALAYVAFVFTLSRSFLERFAPPPPTGETAVDLLYVGGFILALVVALSAKAARSWPRLLWFILAAGALVLAASTIAYLYSRAHLVEYYFTTELQFVKGDELLTTQQNTCDGYDSIAKCLFDNPSKTPEGLYGQPAIEEARTKLLLLYLTFGLSVFLTLSTVLEALVWHSERQKAEAQRREQKRGAAPSLAAGTAPEVRS